MIQPPASKNIAIFASGNGSNAENIIAHLRATGSPLNVALIVTNRADAGVVQRAARLGVPVAVLTRSDINDPATMLGVLEARGIKFIVLAGFLLMIPPFLVDRFEGRMINIHPSLLPRHGGKGMFGRHVHEAVIAAGDRETGITVHRVSHHYDSGAVIFQARVPVDPTDTPGTVEAKIHALEREHFPRVVCETFSPLP